MGSQLLKCHCFPSNSAFPSLVMRDKSPGEESVTSTLSKQHLYFLFIYLQELYNSPVTHPQDRNRAQHIFPEKVISDNNENTTVA